MQKCPKCGTEFEGKVCPECGEAWQEEKTCPNCGTKLAGSARFCNECGYSFTKQPEVSAGAAESAKAPPAKQPSPGTGKLLKRVSNFPAILFGLIAALIPLFFLAPVAVMPGGNFLGESIPSESYGNVYQSGNYEGSPVSASLTAMIVLMACALFFALVLIITSLFLKCRQKRVVLCGKPVYLCNVLAGVGYLFLFALAIVSCVLLAQISQEDGGLGIFQAGAAPILTLVFSLSGCVIAVGCAFAAKHLRSTYPSVAAEREARIAAAKPTSFEIGMRENRKTLIVAVILVLVLAIFVSVSLIVTIPNLHNGTYYVFNCETGEYDTTRYYKLSGGSWQDENGKNGKITFDGNTVTLTYDPSGGGASATTQEGEIHGDVLKINGTVYAQEGHRHTYQNHICVCGYNENWTLKYTLNYTLNKEETGYIITGKGSFNDTELLIPSEYRDKPVTSIGDYAFSGCSKLENIVIPASVTEIGGSAFSGCGKLESVTFEGKSQLTEIGEGAFWNCSSLESIIIPEGVTSIGWGAFYDCKSLTSITIPASVTYIGCYAFFGCSSLESVELERTDGWKVSGYSDMRYAEDVTVSDPQTAAKYLTDTYHEYYWKRT